MQVAANVLRVSGGLLVAALACFACGCGSESPAESADESPAGKAEALESGEYVSRATGVADAPYIGDWEHNWGYVLGYLLPGAKIYAKEVTNDSVYGLIGNSGYGAWDHGHHCGWVSLGGLRGSGSHSNAADICPPSDNDFSLAHGQPHGLFHPGSVVESNGEVQPAVVLPTCPDLTVYANYDPVTHTFHDPDGVESPGRGTPGYGVPQQKAIAGYSGFGTRFLSADRHAVEIKDTQRGGKVTAFGFMHAECIAGSQVGNPSPQGPPPAGPPPACGVLLPGDSLGPGGAVVSCDGRFTFVVQAGDGNLVEYQGGAALWASNTEGHAGDSLAMQTDGNLVLYAGGTPLWNTGTEGHPGAHLAVQTDGNLVVYEGATPLWARFGLANPPPSQGAQPGQPPASPPLHCCALCNDRKQDYHADASHLSCKQASIDFCAINGRGGVKAFYEGDCPDAP